MVPGPWSYGPGPMVPWSRAHGPSVHDIVQQTTKQKPVTQQEEITRVKQTTKQKTVTKQDEITLKRNTDH